MLFLRQKLTETAACESDGSKQKKNRKEKKIHDY